MQPKKFLILVLIGLAGAAPLRGGNRLVNPSFHASTLPNPQGSSIVPWEDITGFDSGWHPADSHGVEDSGSARLGFAYTGLMSFSSLHQCVSLAGGEVLSFGGRALIAESGDETASLDLALVFNSEAGCTPGMEIGEARSGFLTPADGLGIWHGLQATRAPAPAEARSVRFEVLVRSPALGLVRAYLDDLFLVEIEPCAAGPGRLCLDLEEGDGRFAIEVGFETIQGGGGAGEGQAVALSSLGIAQGGVFSFFDPANPEMLIKVLDGCPVNGHRWVFYSAGTNVSLSTTVVDTITGEVWFRANPDLHLAEPVGDTAAFDCG